MGERAGRGRDGRVGPEARARAAPAQRAAGVVLSARARRRLHSSRPDRRPANTGAGGRSGAVGLPRSRHARRREVRSTRPARKGEMSYTLRGRVESRLAALLLPLAACCVLTAAHHRWWPLELCGLMAAVGVALDLQLYHRLLRYQPGWAALPLGLLELGLMLVLVRALGLEAPLVPALALYGGAWAVTQVLGQAGFPLLRLSYATD